MRSLAELADNLAALDGRGYKSYKSISGSYAAAGFTLHIDHVQGDPFAEPSRLRVSATPAHSRLPAWSRSTDGRRVSTADFLNRRLRRALRDASTSRGSGRSGELSVLSPGQQVLRRTSLSVSADGAVEARFRAGLPATGRRILGRQAATLLTGAIPCAVDQSLRCGAIDEVALRRHIETVEDAQALRAALGPAGLVAFVANGSVLPRRSGIDDRPLLRDAVPFVAPLELSVTLETPNSGPLTGLGIRRGITLIVGGGYHGKSTLLHAIERGVYDHVPGDGRERAVSSAGVVKVRAEDGRCVAGVDISNFISDLPDGQATSNFSSENASGSTSQAAAIVEALEVGANCLLLDEDTCATNFMIRDARMQRLVAREHEPITPFIDRVRQLYDEHGISTLLVVGGAGDYFDVADTVIGMRAWEPQDLTSRAAEVRKELPATRALEGGEWRPLRHRRLDPGCLDPRRGRRERSIKARNEESILYGDLEVDLSAVEQIVETAQTRAMAHALAWLHRRAGPEPEEVGALLRAVIAEIETRGLDAVQPNQSGELASFRVFELAAFLNRLRSLAIA